MQQQATLRPQTSISDESLMSGLSIRLFSFLRPHQLATAVPCYAQRQGLEPAIQSSPVCHWWQPLLLKNSKLFERVPAVHAGCSMRCISRRIWWMSRQMHRASSHPTSSPRCPCTTADWRRALRPTGSSTSNQLIQALWPRPTSSTSLGALARKMWPTPTACGRLSGVCSTIDLVCLFDLHLSCVPWLILCHDRSDRSDA